MKIKLSILLALLPLVSVAQDYTQDATESSSSGDALTGGLAICVGLFFYFIPALVGRNHRQASSITLLNLLLGWTLVGWIVALVWAASKSTPPPVPVVAAPGFSVADELMKLQRLHESGALSAAELQAQRAKVLARQ